MTIKVRWLHTPPAAPMGRFGGGWQWEVGAQASGFSRPRGTVIVNLLVASIRIDWSRNEHADPSLRIRSVAGDRVNVRHTGPREPE